jgi:starvation-inducible DNA-binding protein
MDCNAAKDETMKNTNIAADALATPTDLPATEIPSIAEALNNLLANSFALYIKTKNFHWHMSGPHFRDYHLLLDEQAAEIFSIIDAAAERVRKIGAMTLRSIGDVARRQTITDNDALFVSPRDMLAELRSNNQALCDELRAAKKLADWAGDNATSSLLDDWTDAAERRVWFLFEAARG